MTILVQKVKVLKTTQKVKALKTTQKVHQQHQSARSAPQVKEMS
jgi:hypothetical protein